VTFSAGARRKPGTAAWLLILLAALTIGWCAVGGLRFRPAPSGAAIAGTPFTLRVAKRVEGGSVVFDVALDAGPGRAPVPVETTRSPPDSLAWADLNHRGRRYLVTRLENGGSGGGNLYRVFRLEPGPAAALTPDVVWACWDPTLDGDRLEFAVQKEDGFHCHLLWFLWGRATSARVDLAGG
jgi:hypothetical protein